MSGGARSGNSSHVLFVFRGFPSLQDHRRLLALPFSASYVAVLLGNCLLVYVLRSTESLHGPMYVLICSLCVVDVLVATAIVPKMLLGLLLDWDQVSLGGCLTQMFFTHFLSSLESTLLLAMALDRYVAICQPLRYAKIINASTLAKLLPVALARSGAVMATLVALAGSLRFCGSNTIGHCYCDHMALVSLACGSTASSRAAGLAVIACFVGVDIPLIFLSYGQILGAVLRATADGEERWKAFHTCGTHLIAMMCFYFVGSVTFLSHNVNIAIPTDANTVMGLVYILLPATVNPVIYGVRTKDIRKVIVRLFKVRVKTKVSPAGKGRTGRWIGENNHQVAPAGPRWTQGQQRDIRGMLPVGGAPPTVAGSSPGTRAGEGELINVAFEVSTPPQDAEDGHGREHKHATAEC
ncbi:olfactory receptor 51E2-like [Etheostoma cragini]|uniref:olfactory receptor 51E2-like n=1 Tax=Etheostoma cragini TaxID=417921 RepID=UPI00155E067F|nr:olfactory receptor 51E2-like [Etheostoma cragini]